ncbi:MAG: ribonuclease HII [Crocinitomicaceae bacterium]|nr:ribonuclease HII [Crocinitomicaceae bacterium]
MLKSYHTANIIEAGCDEAGRGCLAGPVVAAAVVLPENYKNKILNDSKQLSEKKRKELKSIIEKEALAFAVSFVNHKEIDELNILRASFTAMHRALDQLKIKPDQILVDGNRFIPYHDIPHHCIVKGDGKFLSIAAASILAKTYRDEYMEELHQKYPDYAWDKNKGYPTKAHRDAIRKVGASPFHRSSFKLLPDEQLQMDF